MSDIYPAGTDSPVVTSNDPDRIREQIEVTRASLSTDVNTLSDRVKPGNVARRQADKARGAATGLKDRVMGAAPSLHPPGSAGSGVGDAASVVSDKASALPGAARSRTQGNPLAAGVVAFGLGWLVSSLLPASQAEQHAARAVKSQAEPITEAVTDAAKESAQKLKQPAQEAVESVKQTAQDGVGNVQDEARSAAGDVKGKADEARATVQDGRA